MQNPRHLMLAVSTLVLCVALAPRAAQAGCGCDKPPPPPAQVRPNVAYAGAPVTLFSPSFQPGQPYVVTFTSGTAGATAQVGGVVVSLRDLADGRMKPQLVVTLPALPLGPASMSVSRAPAAGTVLSIPDTAFTVAPEPLALPAAYGAYQWNNVQGAVGRDGVVYLALDVSNIAQPMVFEAQALGYPLRFSEQDLVFFNVQGFLMQRLVQGAGSTVPIPGMFVFPAGNSGADSDSLRYSRHEFTTYFLQHQERLPHAVDPTDPNWHLDGSRHVDHNHLILAIAGQLNDGSLPPAGATPVFNLATTTSSLFYRGMVGSSWATVANYSRTDSFNHRTLLYGHQGDVFTNGMLSMDSTAVIDGKATAAASKLGVGATITAGMSTLASPDTFMQVKVPTLIPNLGRINLNGGLSQTIAGPGSFLLSGLVLQKGSSLFIDNSAGPVTLYVAGKVSVAGGSTLAVADTNPEKFAIYVTTPDDVVIATDSSIYGVIYALQSTLSLGGTGEFFGAFVGDSIKLKGYARLHYDSALRGE